MSRRRDVLVASGLFVAMLFLWSLAPGTGLPRDPHVFERIGLPTSTTRYLYPALTVAATSIGLVAREPGLRGRAATATLLAAGLWCWIVDITTLDSPYLARPSWVAAGAVVGGLVGFGSVRVSPSLGRWDPRAGAAVATVLLVLGLGGGATIVGRNFTGRNALASEDRAVGHQRVPGSVPPELSLIEWFRTQPSWRDGHDPVYLASRWGVAALAGDRVQHRMELLPPNATCAYLRRRAPKGLGRCLGPVLRLQVRRHPRLPERRLLQGSLGGLRERRVHGVPDRLARAADGSFPDHVRRAGSALPHGRPGRSLSVFDSCVPGRPWPSLARTSPSPRACRGRWHLVSPGQSLSLDPAGRRPGLPARGRRCELLRDRARRYRSSGSSRIALALRRTRPPPRRRRLCPARAGDVRSASAGSPRLSPEWPGR